MIYVCKKKCATFTGNWVLCVCGEELGMPKPTDLTPEEISQELMKGQIYRPRPNT